MIQGSSIINTIHPQPMSRPTRSIQLGSACHRPVTANVTQAIVTARLGEPIFGTYSSVSIPEIIHTMSKG